jgi:hypothetical protein
MKALFAFSIILIMSLFQSYGQLPSFKRGMAYGYHSPADLEALSAGLTWWYNWSVTPETSVSAVYGDYGFDFVPMAWNGSFNETQLRAFLTDHPDVKYLLAYNEPNFIEQANMTPSQAAANWPKLEAIADDFNLKIVGPAVNYCGNCVSEGGTTYTDPFKYLDDFFNACGDCRVDYVAVHCYMNTIGALSWYVNEFKKYNRPIWLTEFAGWESNGNINDAGDQESFLIGAVDFLESNPSVYRYSWFIGRTSGGPDVYPYIDLLDADGELTALGNIYVNMPVHDTTYYLAVPGHIEAENYSQMEGMLLEKTSDVSGFANCGYIAANDWLVYNIDVGESRNYALDIRAACAKSSVLEVLVDDVPAATVNLANTGGYQDWQTFSTSFNLDAGRHKLKLMAKTDGFNLNWIAFRDLGPTGLHEPLSTSGMMFPNPAGNIVTFEKADGVSTIEIIDVTGRKQIRVTFQPTVDVSQLREGFYLVRVVHPEKGIMFTKPLIIKR